MKSRRFDNRKIVIGIMVISVVLIYVIRLFQIQILDTRYRNSADNNALYYRTVYPTRGVIYDRNDRMIVSNQPSFDVMVVMRNVKDLDTLSFCRSLDITKDFFDSRMADIIHHIQSRYFWRRCQ